MSALFDMLKPAELSRLTTYCTGLAAILRKRMKTECAPSAVDDGQPIEIRAMSFSTTGLDMVVINPHDGRPYRISIEPDFKPEGAR